MLSSLLKFVIRLGNTGKNAIIRYWKVLTKSVVAFCDTVAFGAPKPVTSYTDSKLCIVMGSSGGNSPGEESGDLSVINALLPVLEDDPTISINNFVPADKFEHSKLCNDSLPVNLHQIATSGNQTYCDRMMRAFVEECNGGVVYMFGQETLRKKILDMLGVFESCSYEDMNSPKCEELKRLRKAIHSEMGQKTLTHGTCVELLSFIERENDIPFIKNTMKKYGYGAHAAAFISGFSGVSVADILAHFTMMALSKDISVRVLGEKAMIIMNHSGLDMNTLPSISYRHVLVTVANDFKCSVDIVHWIKNVKNLVAKTKICTQDQNKRTTQSLLRELEKKLENAKEAEKVKLDKRVRCVRNRIAFYDK